MDNETVFYFNPSSNDHINSFMNNNSNYTSIVDDDEVLLLDHVYSADGFGYPFPTLSPIHLFQTSPPPPPPPPPLALPQSAPQPPALPRTTTLTEELDGDNNIDPISLFSSNCSFQPMLFPDEFTSSSSVSQLLQFGESSSLPSQVQLQQPQQTVQNQHHYTTTTSTSTRTTTTKGQRLKRRKIEQKKVVCRVPVDGSTSDKWAWRKYGQKPIKGSPYPRGYYKCSSSKACVAKKLVEKSYSDPATLVITYKAEHNHPIPTQQSSPGGNKLDSMSTTLAPPTPRTCSCVCTVKSCVEENNNKLLLQQPNFNVNNGSWREDNNSHSMMRNNNELLTGLEVVNSGLSGFSPYHHVMF